MISNKSASVVRASEMSEVTTKSKQFSTESIGRTTVLTELLVTLALDGRGLSGARTRASISFKSFRVS